MKSTIRIGTRESVLAVVQAEIVAVAIRANSPHIYTELVKIKTTGDKILDKTPDKIGGKGVFVKELNEALRRGDCDICVHSYKDVPQEDDEELPIVAVGAREDPRDVLVLPKGVDAYNYTGDYAKKPSNELAPIGCSSRRRQVQLEALYPSVTVAPVRGNVQTRLSKLDSGEYSALVLAAAGLRRLGLFERSSRVFSIEEMLPAGCQGVLAVQGRRGEDYAYLAAFENPDSRVATTAERAFSRRLGFGCGAPAGVFAEVNGETLHIRAMAAVNDIIRRAEITGDRNDAEELGIKLALMLMSEDEVCG